MSVWQVHINPLTSDLRTPTDTADEHVPINILWSPLHEIKKTSAFVWMVSMPLKAVEREAPEVEIMSARNESCDCDVCLLEIYFIV